MMCLIAAIAGAPAEVFPAAVAHALARRSVSAGPRHHACLLLLLDDKAHKAPAPRPVRADEARAGALGSPGADDSRELSKLAIDAVRPILPAPAPLRYALVGTCNAHRGFAGRGGSQMAMGASARMDELRAKRSWPSPSRRSDRQLSFVLSSRAPKVEDFVSAQHHAIAQMKGETPAQIKIDCDQSRRSRLGPWGSPQVGRSREATH